VCGNGILEPGEQCDDGNTRDGDGCSPACMKDVLIQPKALESHQVSGNRDISPSKETKDSMLHYHLDSLSGTIALCINTAGIVTRSEIKIQSGYEEYDNQLVAATRAWRYRPYLINDRPAPACSTVEFLYKLPQ
jgi:TonB family protein